MGWVAFAVVLLSALSCAHQGEWGRRVNWQGLSLGTLPTQDDYPGASAVVLLDEAEMDVLSGSQLPLSIFERHRIVKVLSRRGFRYANVVIPYDSKSTVEKIRARTISPDGRITVLDPADIYDISLYPQYVWYSDQRAKIFALPNVEVGSVLEYRYTMTIGNLTFWHSWLFQDDDPVLLSRFKLVSPAEWDVEYKVYGLNVEPKVQKAPKGFRSTYVWEARDVAPLKPEFGMPPLRECAARLAIAPAGMKSWRDVGEWYGKLAGPQMEANEAIRKLANRLTRDATTDREKLRRLYEWVRDQVRYIAVEIGIGGFRPHPAAEVLRHRYGDCKDMATLLCTLAQEAGLDVRQAILSTWQNGRPDTSLHSQLQFNHVIAVARGVDSTDVWMDPTEKGCPFGKLPWYDQGLPALVVCQDGQAELVTTPAEPPDSNRLVLRWVADLDSSGGALVRGSLSLRGAQASELREQYQLMSDEAKRVWLETSLAARCSGAELQRFSVEGLDPVRDPLRIQYTFRTSTFAAAETGRLTIFPGQFTGFDLPDLFRPRERRFPVRFRFGSWTELDLTLHLPRGFWPVEPQTRDSVRSDFGLGRWEWSTCGNTLRLQFTYRLSGRDVRPKDYPRFREFLEAIRTRNLRPVVLTRAEGAVRAQSSGLSLHNSRDPDLLSRTASPVGFARPKNEKGYSILSIPSTGARVAPSLAPCIKR